MLERMPTDHDIGCGDEVGVIFDHVLDEMNIRKRLVLTFVIAITRVHTDPSNTAAIA